MKILSMKIITPLRSIGIITSPKQVEKDELDNMLSEWGTILSGDANWFKFPTEDNKAYVLPKEVLKNSYLEIKFEENTDG